MRRILLILSNELSHIIVMEPFYFIQLITCWNLLPQKKDRKKNLIFLSSIFFAILIVYNYILFNKGFEYAMSLTFIIFTIPGFIIYLLISKYRDGRLIFCYFFSDSILSIFNFISYYACISYFKEINIFFSLSRIFLIIIFSLVFNIFYIPKIRKALDTKEVNWNIIALISTFAGIYIYYELIIRGSILERQDELFSISITFILLAIVFLTLLWTLVKIQEKEIQQIELLKKEYSLNLIQFQLKQVDSTYEQINSTYDKIRMLRHDFNKELSILENICSEGDIEKIKNYLEKITNKLPQYNLFIYSNNHMLNSILNYYKQKMNNLNIKNNFKINIEVDNEDLISDLCLIIANALDNAIEAVENIDNKYINLTIISKNNSLFISVNNSFDCSKIRKKDNKIISSKEDSNNHGLGLLIIENITNNYNGNCNYTFEETEFRLKVYLTY